MAHNISLLRSFIYAFEYGWCCDVFCTLHMHIGSISCLANFRKMQHVNHIYTANKRKANNSQGVIIRICRHVKYTGVISIITTVLQAIITDGVLHGLCCLPLLCTQSHNICYCAVGIQDKMQSHARMLISPVAVNETCALPSARNPPECNTICSLGGATNTKTMFYLARMAASRNRCKQHMRATDRALPALSNSQQATVRDELLHTYKQPHSHALARICAVIRTAASSHSSNNNTNILFIAYLISKQLLGM